MGASRRWLLRTLKQPGWRLENQGKLGNISFELLTLWYEGKIWRREESVELIKVHFGGVGRKW